MIWKARGPSWKMVAVADSIPVFTKGSGSKIETVFVLVSDRKHNVYYQECR